MVDLIKLTNLLDEAKCYEVIRQLRWPDGVICLHCSGTGVVRNGHDDRERHRQRYWCKTCKYRFDDLTGMVLAGHHQPVSTWILVVHPANRLRLSCSRAVEGSCLSAWEQGHDASVAGPDG